MNREKMIEALAEAIEAAIWENSDEGTFDHGANSQAIVHDMAKASAAAVLDLCGPKPLVWLRGSAMGAIARYTVAQSDFDDGYGEIWYILIDNKTAGKLGQFSTEESAQAAAQSHADAAHWANTGMGDLIGGK